MRKTVHKLFWAWDFDREEQWLNEMAAKGLALTAIGFCIYVFEECAPGAYTVRIELLEHPPRHVESKNYIHFLEDTGAEYLGSILRWVYFRKKTEEGAFDLFSDSSSRIQHLGRLLTLLSILCIMLFCVGGMNILTFLTDGLYENLGAGIAPLCLGALITYGVLRVLRIRRKLKKEQQLFE